MPEHDFKTFPELPNSKFAEHYFNSPHKQIVNNFTATIVKVHDGDTVTLQAPFRDFNFPFRIKGIDAPELSAPGGEAARDYLKERIEGKLAEIIIDPKQRVEKWGRLLGDIIVAGTVASEEMLTTGNAWLFEDRRPGEIENANKTLNVEKWLTF